MAGNKKAKAGECGKERGGEAQENVSTVQGVYQHRMDQNYRTPASSARTFSRACPSSSNHVLTFDSSVPRFGLDFCHDGNALVGQRFFRVGVQIFQRFKGVLFRVENGLFFLLQIFGNIC